MFDEKYKEQERIDNIYKQLTSVDIGEQKRIWDERGKGYYGEYLLFCELYKHISGNCKILMNLNIPVADSKTTEIDLMLIHETGIYVFEIKHYKGTIYGKSTDATWTQYFRTVKNNTFKNPMLQNAYHINALKQLLPIEHFRSFIVFTNGDIDIKVENTDRNVNICCLRNVVLLLENRFASEPARYSMEKIDELFTELSQYSQMNEPVSIDGEAASFFAWIQPITDKIKSEKEDLSAAREQYITGEKRLNRTRKICKIATVLVAIVCAIVFGLVAWGVAWGVIEQNNAELSRFKQKFLRVDEIENEYIKSLQSYVEVSNVSISPVAQDAVSFTARLTAMTDIYGISLTKNSKYIVMTTEGNVFEYNVFGEHLKYYTNSNRIGKGIRPYGDLARIQFFGISDTSEIAYIKITGIELFKLDTRRTVIKDNLEIELYSIYQ